MNSSFRFALLSFALAACQPAAKKDVTVARPAIVIPARNPYYSRTDTTTLHIPDSIWKAVLPANIFQVGRKQATEKAFSGKFWNYSGLGKYYCAICGNPLFRSDGKFSSNCGWPSFFEPSGKNSVTYQPDKSHGLDRIEVLCGRCNSHLGHLFDDGPPPTGKRYCMNSLILDFEPDLGL